MRKPIFLIFFVLSSCFKTVVGQNACIDSTFSKAIYSTNRTLSANRITTNDNGVLAITTETNPGISQRQGLIKFDNLGNIQWSIILTPISTSEALLLKEIIQLRDGNFVLAAELISTANQSDKLILFKIDLSGTILWQTRLRNNYGSSPSNTVRVRNIQEGLNGDILFLSEDGNSHPLAKANLTRLNAAGNVIWSNAYFGPMVFSNGSMNFRTSTGNISLWGTNYSGSGNCFRFQESLQNIELDYSSGALRSAKSFCIPPGFKKIGIDNIWNSQVKNVVAVKLQNEKTVLFIHSANTERTLLFAVFDEQNNFIRSTLYSPPLTSNELPDYFFDVNKQTGKIVFNFSQHINNTPYIYPFNFFGFLNDSLMLTKQIFVRNITNDTLIGSGKFLKNGQLNFLAGSRQIIAPQFYQLNFVNTLEGAATTAFCNAKDSIHGNFEPHGFVLNNTNFQFDSLKNNIYTNDGSTPIIASSFSLQESEGCKKYSVCDSLKLFGSSTICLNPNDTIYYKFYKNPQCLKEVKWAFDTSFAIFTGVTNDTILGFKFKKEGRTKISIGLAGCILSDSIIVDIGKPLPPIKITSDNFLCPGGDLILHATPGYFTYQWQDGSTADSLFINQAGKYKLISTDACGRLSADSVIVKLVDTSVIFTPFVNLCLTDTLEIPMPASMSNVSWQPLQSVSLQNRILKFYPSQSTNYTLNFTVQPGCTFNRVLNITVKVCPETIFFPNSFTPNNDGLNDIFKPGVSLPLRYYRLNVFNRYGQKVFESSDQQNGWDGFYKGSAQPLGAYTWHCVYQFGSKDAKSLKGTLLLLR